MNFEIQIFESQNVLHIFHINHSYFECFRLHPRQLGTFFSYFTLSGHSFFFLHLHLLNFLSHSYRVLVSGPPCICCLLSVYISVNMQINKNKYCLRILVTILFLSGMSVCLLVCLVIQGFISQLVIDTGISI